MSLSLQEIVKVCLEAFQDAVRVVKTTHDINVFNNESVDVTLRFAKEIASNLGNAMLVHSHIVTLLMFNSTSSIFSPIYVYVYLFICICICMYMYIYMYLYAYVYVYECSCQYD